VNCRSKQSVPYNFQPFRQNPKKHTFCQQHQIHRTSTSEAFCEMAFATRENKTRFKSIILDSKSAETATFHITCQHKRKVPAKCHLARFLKIEMNIEHGQITGMNSALLLAWAEQLQLKWSGANPS
jgi:hypothetical protein